MWLGFQRRPASPVRWDLLTPMTEVAGKGLAGALGQHLPVFCWKLSPDHVAPILFGCLAVTLFVPPRRRPGVSRVVGRGLGRGGARREVNHS